MSLPQHPSDDTDETGFSESARSKVMIVLGILVVAILVGLVVVLHLTGVLSPSEVH